MTALPNAEAANADIVGFLQHEARLLDEAAFENWLALFDDRGVYWIPAAPGQTDPKTHISIMYEDKPILAMRIQRLAHPRAHALESPPRANRLISNFWSGPAGNGEIEAGCAFVMTEIRGAETRIFSGTSTYRLIRDDGTYRILMKRVDLLNCDSVHGLITLPF